MDQLSLNLGAIPLTVCEKTKLWVWANNPDYLLEMIEKHNDPTLFLYASKARLQRNPDFLKRALKINFKIFALAQEIFKNNLNFLIEALDFGVNPGILEYVPSFVTEDSLSMLKLAQVNLKSLGYLSENLRNSPDFALRILKIDGISSSFFRSLFNGAFFEKVDFMAEAVKYIPSLLSLWPESAIINNSMDILTTALKKDPTLLCFIGGQVRKNKKDLLELLEIFVENFDGSPEQKNALKSFFKSFAPYYPYRVEDPELVLKVLPLNIKLLRHVDKEIKNNKEYILKSLEMHGKKFDKNLIGSSLLNDPEVIRAFLKYFDGIPLGDELKENKSFALELIRLGYTQMVDYFDKKLSADPEIFLACLLQGGSNFPNFQPETWKLLDNEDFAFNFLRQSNDVNDFVRLSKRLKNDPKFIHKLMSVNGIFYVYLPEKFKKNLKITVLGIQNHLSLEEIKNFQGNLQLNLNEFAENCNRNTLITKSYLNNDKTSWVEAIVKISAENSSPKS